MEIDVYAPCPCGSGKKLKFCCAPIVEEMAKVARLQAGDQPRQALALVEKLAKANPTNAWVATTEAELLIGSARTAAGQRADRTAAERADRLSPGFCRLGTGQSLLRRLRSGPPGHPSRFAEMPHALPAERRHARRGRRRTDAGRAARDVGPAILEPGDAALCRRGTRRNLRDALENGRRSRGSRTRCGTCISSCRIPARGRTRPKRRKRMPW